MSRMTNRIKGLVVTLKDDIRIDDLEPLIRAISLFTDVIYVEPVIGNNDDRMNRQRVRIELETKLLKDLNDD